MVFLLYSVTMVKPTSHSQDKSSENTISTQNIHCLLASPLNTGALLTFSSGLLLWSCQIGSQCHQNSPGVSQRGREAQRMFSCPQYKQSNINQGLIVNRKEAEVVICIFCHFWSLELTYLSSKHQEEIFLLSLVSLPRVLIFKKAVVVIPYQLFSSRDHKCLQLSDFTLFSQLNT